MCSAAGRRVRMTENCKKPAFSVANTGSSGTPVQTSRPCGRWVVGVFQGRLFSRKKASKCGALRFVGCAESIAALSSLRRMDKLAASSMTSSPGRHAVVEKPGITGLSWVTLVAVWCVVQVGNTSSSGAQYRHLRLVATLRIGMHVELICPIPPRAGRPISPA